MLCIMDVKTFGGVYQLSYNYLHLSFRGFALAKHYFYVGYMLFFMDALTALENDDCVKLIMHYIDHQYCCF